MEFFADYHTHTIYSDGRGTVEANARAAKEKGLEIVGITDHGPNNIGVGVKDSATYLKIKEDARQVMQEVEGLRIMVGAEADIIDLDGTIDVSREALEQLDHLIVGLHPYVWGSSPGAIAAIVAGNQLALVSRGIKEKIKVSNTKALIESVYKYDVFCISHPGLKMPVDIEELAPHCVKQDVALEINTGHDYNKNELVEKALATEVKLVVNSDAHFPETVGQLLSGKLLLERYDVPPDRVINAKKVK